MYGRTVQSGDNIGAKSIDARKNWDRQKGKCGAKSSIFLRFMSGW